LTRVLTACPKLELQHTLRPAEVLVEGNKARLIRRRETMADCLRPNGPADKLTLLPHALRAILTPSCIVCAGDFIMGIGNEVFCGMEAAGLALGYL